jgi:hypothetical protein
MLPALFLLMRLTLFWAIEEVLLLVEEKFQNMRGLDA